MSLAYLDPGSGSLIASALVGGAAAAGVAVKTARARFTGAFSRKKRSAEDQSPQAEETEAPAEETDAPAEADAAAEGEAVDATASSDA